LAQLLRLPLSALHQLLQPNHLRLYDALLVNSPPGCLDILEISVGSWATLCYVRRAVLYAPVGGHEAPSVPVF
jgi:hypothetical protein